MGSSLTNISLLGMITLSVVYALGYSAKANAGLTLPHDDSSTFESSADTANLPIAPFRNQAKEVSDLSIDLVSDVPSEPSLESSRLSQTPAIEPDEAPLQEPFLPDSPNPVETAPVPVPQQNSSDSEASTSEPLIPSAGSDDSEESTSEPLMPSTGSDAGDFEGLDVDHLLSAPDLLTRPDSPEALEIDHVVPLTLEQAIRLAEANNRNLQITRAQLRRDQALLDQARAQLFPTLALQGQVSRQLDASSEISTRATRNQLNDQIAETETAINAIEQALPGITDPVEAILLTLQLSQLQQTLQSSQLALNQLNTYSTTTLSGGVQVNYSLYSPQRTASIQQAEAQAQFTELEVNRVQEEIRLQVTNAYYDLQDASAQAEIFRADIERRRRNLGDLEALLNAGLATRLDVLNSQVELDTSQQNLINAESQVQSAQSTLVQILSIPPGVTVTAAESVATVDPWELSLEETIFLALQNRVELDQQLAQRRVAEAQRRAALAGTLPQVNLFATYDVLGLSTGDPRSSAVQGFGDGYSLGLTASWLLLDGGSANAGARAAEAIIEVADLQFSQTSNQIRAEITQTYASLLANAENLQTARNAVARAEEALRLARLRFQAGVGTQTDVLDADFRLTQSLGNLKTAALGYNRSVAALQRFVGITYPPATDSEANE